MGSIARVSIEANPCNSKVSRMTSRKRCSTMRWPGVLRESGDGGDLAHAPNPLQVGVGALPFHGRRGAVPGSRASNRKGEQHCAKGLAHGRVAAAAQIGAPDRPGKNDITSDHRAVQIGGHPSGQRRSQTSSTLPYAGACQTTQLSTPAMLTWAPVGDRDDDVVGLGPTRLGAELLLEHADQARTQQADRVGEPVAVVGVDMSRQHGGGRGTAYGVTE